MEEHRKHIRFPASDIRITCLVESDGCKFDTICKDISCGGVRIPETIKPHEKVSLKFLFPPNNKTSSIKGIVVRGACKDTGIRFLGHDRKTFESIDSYISFFKKVKEPDISSLLRRFSRNNIENISEIFYEALSLLYYKQIHFKRPILSSKMILYALDLVKDYIFKFKPVEAKNGLGELLVGGKLSEEKALEYFCTIPGEVKDIYGRVIKLGDIVWDSLFKDPETGKKIKGSENYSSPRAKRLPWIVYTLRNTKQIYEKNESMGMGITYYYTMPFNVTYHEEITNEVKTKTGFHLVVTRRKKGKSIEFVTAYTPDSRFELFKKMCNSRPYDPLSDKGTSSKKT